jgi:hypothetical protein
MADRFYSGEFGATMKTEITETGTTTAPADVELRVTYDASNASKQALLMAIEAIKQKVVEDTFPPV